MKRDRLFVALVLMIGIAACQHQSVSSATFTPRGEPSYSVDFSHPFEKGWCKVRAEAWGEYYCTASELHLVNRTSNPVQLITPMGTGDPIYRDFMLQATMRSVSESGSYGVGFRRVDGPTCCYIFRVRTTGEFQLLIYGRKDIVLVPWTSSTAVRKGRAVNLLQVRVQGSHITVFANGEALTAVDNGALSEGSVFAVASEDGHAAISSLQVWALP